MHLHLHRLTATAAGLAILLVAAPAASAAPRDRDHDGLPDKWERKYKTKSAKSDKDKDGLSARAEYKSRTSPNRADTDRDGVRDGAEDFDRDKLANAIEVATANDPGKKDSDADDILDTREGAGQVVAVNGTQVTIALAAKGGQQVTGRAEPGATLCQPAWEWTGPWDTSSDEFEDAVQAEETRLDTIEDGEESDAEVAQADAEDGDAGSGILFNFRSLGFQSALPAPDPNQTHSPVDPAKVEGNPVLSDDELEKIEDAEYDRIGHEDDPDWRETTDACPADALTPGAWIHEVTMSRSAEAGVEFEELLIVT